MAMNPIMLVVIAIGLLVAAAVYAFYHFKGFHDFIMASWAIIKEAGIALWHMLESAFKGIANAAKAVWDFLVGAFNGIVNAVTSFGSSVWKGITSVWDAIADFFKKWWPLLLVLFALPIAVLMSIWNHFHTQITEVASTVWNAVKDFFVAIWDGLVTAAKASWGFIHDYIVDPIVSAWHWLESVNNAINSALLSAWHWLEGVASSVWGSIKDNIINPLQGALNWIMGFVSGVSNTISSGFTSILNWLGGIGNSFINVGEDIVNGIIHGVENAGGWLMDKLKNLANGALNAAKSFLGIGSPSKEFANQVGQWIPHGIAQGIEEHSQTAIDAVSGLATALPQAIGVQGSVNIGMNGINAAGSTFATGLGLGVTAASGKGGGDIHIHMDMRDAVVAGDRGMDDLVNKMGNAIATRILPQAGVRIRG
jgi:phage-related protein